MSTRIRRGPKGPPPAKIVAPRSPESAAIKALARGQSVIFEVHGEESHSQVRALASMWARRLGRTNETRVTAEGWIGVWRTA